MEQDGLERVFHIHYKQMSGMLPITIENMSSKHDSPVRRECVNVNEIKLFKGIFQTKTNILSCVTFDILISYILFLTILNPNAQNNQLV